MSINDLKLARQKLSANNIESGLPGREEHSEEIFNFINERLKIRATSAAKKAKVEAGLVADIAGRHMNKTIFICGVPGTGKTVTVECVLKRLEKIRDKKNSPIHDFVHIYVNGQHLSSADRIYSEILYKLTGENKNPDLAQEKLQRLFLPNSDDIDEDVKKPGTNGSRKRSATSSSKKFNSLLNCYKIIVIDELDLIYNDRKQSTFYSLFDWPTHAESKMILIGIANAMDLSDRLIKKEKSRMGLEKRVFESYTGTNLQTILEYRLGLDLLNRCFKKEAVIVATRRIGKMTGDARRILDTSRLAIDKAIRMTEETGKFHQVTPQIVDEVGFQNFDIQRKEFIETCRPMLLFLLKSILKETVRVGEENVNAKGVYIQLMNHLKKIELFKQYLVSLDEFADLLTELSAVGMIYLEGNKNLPFRRMFLIDDSDALRELIINEQMKI